MKKKQDKQKEPEVVVDKEAENKNWMTQLTKKNEDYIFQLQKHLNERGVTEAQQTEILYDMLSVVVYSQKKGQTARQLYGTPTEYANKLIEDGVEVPSNQSKSPDWQVGLDAGLLFLALLAGITGVMGLFTKSGTQSQQGIISMLITAIMMGAVVVITNRTMNKAKGRGRAIWQTIILMVGVLLLMFMVVAVLTLISPKINVPLSPEMSIVVAVVAIVAKIILKRTLNIQGGVFDQRF